MSSSRRTRERRRRRRAGPIKRSAESPLALPYPCEMSQQPASGDTPSTCDSDATITSPDGPSAGASDPERCELPVDNTVRAEEDGGDRKVPIGVQSDQLP